MSDENDDNDDDDDDGDYYDGYLKNSLKKTRGRDKEIATSQTKGTKPRQVLQHHHQY